MATTRPFGPFPGGAPPTRSASCAACHDEMGRLAGALAPAAGPAARPPPAASRR
jgi:hypothetical protein